MNVRDAWALLGIEPTDEAREVKRAYARVLKTIDSDADPAAFVRLRVALETAQSWGTATPEWELSEEEWKEQYGGSDAPEGFDEDFAFDALGPDFPAGGLPFPWSGDVWRAPAPAGLGHELAAAAQELESALFDAPQADAERIEALGARLLAVLDLSPVDDAVPIESWLASAISAAIPRSDPLIGPAVARFRWDRRAASWRDNWDIESVLRRQEDLGFVHGCRKRAHPQHRAFCELSGPPRAKVGLFELGLVADVRDLLRIVHERHPTMERDFDPASLEWWRSYLEGPRLPEHFWLMLLGIPPFTTFALALVWENRLVGALPVILFYLGSVATVSAVLLAYSRIRAKLRRIAADRQWRPDSYERKVAGYALAALLLPPVAGAVQLGMWSAVPVAIASLALLGGLWRHLPPPQYEDESGRAYRQSGAIVAAVVGAALLIGLPTQAALHLVLPLAALALAAASCHEMAGEAFGRLSRPRQLGALAAVAALCVLLGGAVLFFPPRLPPPWLAALVPVAVVAQHWATAASMIATPRLDWPVRTAAILFYFAAGPFWYGAERPRALAAAACVYALVYGLARLGIVAAAMLRAPGAAARG